MGPIVVFVVLIGGTLAALRFFASGGETVGGYRQAGASGLPERLFFWIFGSPRDPAKEAQLSWTKVPDPPRPTGFRGRGVTRRW